MIGIKKMKDYPVHNSNCMQPRPTAFDYICKVGVWIFDHILLVIWHKYVDFLDLTVFSEVGSTGFISIAMASTATIILLGIIFAILLALFSVFCMIVYNTKIALIAIGTIGTIVGLVYAASKCSDY